MSQVMPLRGQNNIIIFSLAIPGLTPPGLYADVRCADSEKLESKVAGFTQSCRFTGSHHFPRSEMFSFFPFLTADRCSRYFRKPHAPADRSCDARASQRD